jgi:hypothetical protein
MRLSLVKVNSEVPHRDPAPLASESRGTPPLGGELRGRDDHGSDAVPCNDLIERLHGAENGIAVEDLAQYLRVIVDEADGTHVGVGLREQFPHH